MQSYDPDLFELGQCTYVAKAGAKVTVKHLQGGKRGVRERARESERERSPTEVICKCKQCERTVD